MTGRRIEVVVGVTVILAIIVAVVGILWLGNYKLGQTRNRVVAVFEDGSGVKAGDPVTVYGVTKGKVEGIRLDQQRVELVLLVDSEIRLFADAQAWVLDAGMMGEKRVEVRPGTGPTPLDLSRPIRGARGGGLTETVRDVGALAAQVGELVRLLRRDVLNDGAGNSIRQTIEHAERTTQDLEGMARENRAGLKAAVADLRATSSEVRGLLEERGDSLTLLIDRANAVSARLDTLTSRIERGEGTLGLLLKDEELYQNLKSTSKGLDELIRDFKEHPGKYIKLRIF
jgi:phospholipid/cholesterol/gamma-HCH transport system substrate-binding protein